MVPRHPQPVLRDPELVAVVDDWWAESMSAPVAREVLLAAIELFAERGYHATTTRDIVTRVGMSTGAMYAYFRSKEHLLFEVCLTGHRRGVQALEEAATADTGPTVALPAMVRAFSIYHARCHTIAKVVHYELYGLSPEHLEQVLDLRRRATQLINEVVRDGVESGAFAVPEVAGVGRALLSLCIDVARWYQHRHPTTPEEVGDLYATLSLRMVGSR